MRRFVRPLQLTAAALALTIAVSPVYASTMSEIGTNTVTESVSAVSEDTKDTSSSLKEDERELKEDISEDISEDVSEDISKDTSKAEESKEIESEITESEGEKDQTHLKAEDDTKETEVEVKETETSDDTVRESQPAKEDAEITHESEATLENEKTDTVLSDEKTPNEAEGNTVKNEVKEIEAVKIVLPKPVRDGYEFVEWNTRIDGEGESYQAGDEIEVTPMALYAIWREA